MRLPPVRSVWLAFGAAVFFTFAYNVHIGLRLADIFGKLESVDPFFVASIPLVFISFFNMALLLLSARFMQKTVLIALIIFSSFISYASFQYGIVFDDEMFQNIAETNTAESISYLNGSLFVWFVFTGFLPAFLVWKLPQAKQGWKKEWLQKGVSFLASVCVIGVTGYFYYPDYASTVRNNTILRKSVVPNYALKNAYDYLHATYTTPEVVVKKELGTDAQQAEENRLKRHYLIVLVVGETQRAANYSLGGYPRPTNRFTEKQGGVYFENVSSCGTATAVSVPCMFSFMGREGYDKEDARAQDGLIDVLARQGTRVIWIDNDSGCKGVCAAAEYTDIRVKYKDRKESCDAEGCFDELVAEDFKSILPTLEKKDTVVVLHMMGSHGPKYWRRYPREYAVFTPDCQQGDIQNCTQESLMNAYDNTIYYEDYVISDVIDSLRAHAEGWNSVLVFMSDHGESLGENGVYLHGLPYALAPKEQTHIPLYAWLSDNFLEHEEGDMDLACLSARAKEGHFSHDGFPHAILGLLDIESELYKPEIDFLRDCRNPLHGL